MSIRSSSARRERARAQAREDILLAAAEVFARRGYAAATLAELAAGAGFAAPSLYRYFESKEEIFRSLLDLVERELAETFEAPVEADAPLARKLEGLLLAQHRLIESRRAVIAVLRAPDAPDVRGQKSSDFGLAFYQARLADWLGRHAAPGELRVPAALAARAFAGIVFAFHPHEEASRDDADLRCLVVSLALEGIAAPARGRRGATP